MNIPPSNLSGKIFFRKNTNIRHLGQSNLSAISKKRDYVKLGNDESVSALEVDEQDELSDFENVQRRIVSRHKNS